MRDLYSKILPINAGFINGKNKIGFIDYYFCKMEQVTGIEPALEAWEASVLPLNYTCKNACKDRHLFYIKSR